VKILYFILSFCLNIESGVETTLEPIKFLLLWENNMETFFRLSCVLCSTEESHSSLAT